MITFRMYIDLKFDRALDGSKDFMSFGGYEMTMNKKQIRFDFEDIESGIDKHDPTILHVMCKNPDVDTFPDINQINENDLANVTSITEFSIDFPVLTKIMSIDFILPYDNWKDIPVSKAICQAYKFG